MYSFTYVCENEYYIGKGIYRKKRYDMKQVIPESFRQIPSFPDYYIEEYGSNVIKLCKDGTIKYINQNNNFGVTLFKDGKRYFRSRFQLAFEAWGQKVSHTGKYKIRVSALNVAKGSKKWIPFDSLIEASEKTGVPVSSISKIINYEGLYTSHGWSFKRWED